MNTVPVTFDIDSMMSFMENTELDNQVVDFVRNKKEIPSELIVEYEHGSFIHVASSKTDGKSTTYVNVDFKKGDDGVFRCIGKDRSTYLNPPDAQ